MRIPIRSCYSKTALILCAEDPGEPVMGSTLKLTILFLGMKLSFYFPTIGTNTRTSLCKITIAYNISVYNIVIFAHYRVLKPYVELLFHS